MPAAFRRLCVETKPRLSVRLMLMIQPPLGGCVLKLVDVADPFGQIFQPPLGGCVLKPVCEQGNQPADRAQPPLGGCVLKQQLRLRRHPARRGQPPLGGCVLKHNRLIAIFRADFQPPLGGCVLKPYKSIT